MLIFLGEITSSQQDIQLTHCLVEVGVSRLDRDKEHLHY